MLQQICLNFKPSIFLIYKSYKYIMGDNQRYITRDCFYLRNNIVSLRLDCSKKKIFPLIPVVEICIQNGTQISIGLVIERLWSPWSGSAFRCSSFLISNSARGFGPGRANLFLQHSAQCSFPSMNYLLCTLHFCIQMQIISLRNFWGE